MAPVELENEGKTVVEDKYAAAISDTYREVSESAI